jgi:flagellar export protein FliJ
MTTKPRFQVLLDLYHRQEDDRRRALGRHERQRAERLACLAALAAERDGAAVVVTPAWHELYARYWARLGLAMDAERKECGRIEGVIDGERGELVAIHRQVATFEKLRERDRKAELRAQEHRDGRRLDEFAARGYIEHTTDPSGRKVVA